MSAARFNALSLLEEVKESLRIQDLASWQLSLVILVISFFIIIIYRLYLCPLSHIPGPTLAKVTGFWRSYRYLRGTWHDDILQVHRKYGPIVRIAPNELSVVDANVTKQLYGHGHNAQKTSWYDTWETPGVGLSFFAEQNKKIHSHLRRRVSSAYSMTAILKFEAYIQGCLDLMLRQLQTHAEAGATINMAEWTNALAFDVVGELAYGSKFGHIQAESDVLGLRKTIFDGFYIWSNLGHFPFQSKLINNGFVNSLLSLLGVPNPAAKFQEWSEAKVRSRMDNLDSAEREDMLAHFIQMKNEKGERVSFDEVLLEALNIIGAGADTTSIGMRSCLYYLCSKPDVYRKIQQEIDDFYEKKCLSRPITYQQTLQMPYTIASCKEAMRLLPSISYQLLRYAPAGLNVNGKTIPAGTPVGVSPIAQNRDKEVFGADADDFRPERWLEEGQNTRLMDSINLTFGGNGPRMCIGRNLALVEVHKFIVQLLRNFDVGFVDSSNPWRLETRWFTFQHDMHMWIKVRPNRALGA